MKNFLIKNQNKALFILLLAETILYYFCGHLLIESAYKSESISVFNDLFKGRTKNSLVFYLHRADLFYSTINIVLYSFIYALSLLLRTFSEQKQSSRNIQINITRTNLLSIIKNKEILPSFILFFIFSILYIYLGLSLVGQHDKIDFLGGDIWKAGRAWTTFSATKPTYFKGSHPLFLLFVCPWGSLLNSLTKSPEVTVTILDSLFGAFAVFLSSIFFKKLTNKSTQALLLATVFGLSMSQLVFSSVPETYALAGCSIITTYILFLTCLQEKKLYIGYWILAGLFTFSVTITNFTQTLICFIITVLILRRGKTTLTVILEFIGSVVALAFILSIFQKIIITHAPYFFMPDTVGTETKYIHSFLSAQPLIVMKELVKHFFVVNFVSPYPFMGISSENHSQIELTFFMHKLNYSLIGGIGTIIWLCLLIPGFLKNILSVHKNALILALGGSLLFNMAFHSFFGTDEMFLYTCNFTFIVLALAIHKLFLNQVYFKIGLVLLIIFMLINNLMIMEKIINL